MDVFFDDKYNKMFDHIYISLDRNISSNIVRKLKEKQKGTQHDE